MVSSSTQPKHCADPNCRGQHELAERMAMAATLCKLRGEQFTKLRRRILEKAIGRWVPTILSEL